MRRLRPRLHSGPQQPNPTTGHPGCRQCRYREVGVLNILNSPEFTTIARKREREWASSKDERYHERRH